MVKSDESFVNNPYLFKGAKSKQMRLVHSFEGRIGADYSLIDIMSNTDRVFYLRFSAFFCG
jgi:hypothetical protein